MFQVTELIAEWDKNNHKRILSTLVDRKNHSFETLKELALFTRENYIFTSFQKEITEVPRNNDAGEKLYIGNNLLWLDLDFEVNLKSLKEKLEELNLTCFAYYSSSHYSSKISKARLCIVCDKVIDKDNWSQSIFFANQILNKLKMKQFPDKAIYNLSSYLAKVKGDYEKGDLFVLEGKPFSWIKQESFIKKYKSTVPEKKEKIVQIAGFGKIGELTSFISSLDSVDTAIARSKGTINISFTKIPEKTPLGYFINVDNPWTVCHANKDKKPLYLSNCLSEEDFEEFKDFYSDNIYVNTYEYFPLNDIRWNSFIHDQYIESKIFKDMAPTLVPQKLIFLESPTGSGKTTAISDWIKENPEKSILLISVNRMQAIATYKSLTKKGIEVTCYLNHSNKEKKKKSSIYNLTFQENARTGIIPKRLICGILSLHHLINGDGTLKRDFDYVIIDEITTLPNSVSNNVGLIYERLNSLETALKAFKRLLISAEKVICMDGFISSSSVGLISKLSKKKPYIIKNEIVMNKNAEIFICSGGQPKFKKKGTCKKFLDLMIEDVKASDYGIKKRVLVIALSTLELSKDLYDVLKENFPDKKIQIFNSEETEKDPIKIMKMFEDLDAYMESEGIDILIYSPSITTGIDIPQTEGTNVYQIISSDHLSSHTNYQMTMRGRKAKCYRILMSKLLMSDKKYYNSFDDYISSSIQEVKECFPFKTPKSIKWKSKNFKTSGFLMMYSKLEYNILEKEWKKVKNISSLKKALLSMSKSLNYDLEGLKVAYEIDKAYIEFQKELCLSGKNGYEQYLNFLKHEQCNISIEEDVDYKVKSYKGKYDSSKERYEDSNRQNYTSQLKELDCWKKEYEDLTSTVLFRKLKIAKAFSNYKNSIIKKFGVGKLYNKETLEIYNYMFKQCLKDNKTGLGYLDKESKKDRILVTKTILSTLFQSNQERGYITILQ